MLTDRRRGLSAFAADDRGVPETDRGDAMPELGCDGRGDEGGRNLDGLGDAARGKLDVAEGVFNLEDGPSPVGVLVANRDGCGSADGVAMVLVCWSSRTWGLGGDCSVETGQDKDAAQGRPGCMRKRDVFTTKVGWMQSSTAAFTARVFLTLRYRPNGLPTRRKSPVVVLFSTRSQWSQKLGDGERCVENRVC